MAKIILRIVGLYGKSSDYANDDGKCPKADKALDYHEPLGMPEQYA